MPQTADTNRRVVLAERPHGLPDAKTLQVQHSEVPTAGAGQMLLRTRYLSLDPYMRGRMNDAKSYAEPVKLGEVMTGQVVAEVIQSNCDGYAVGDHVLAGSGWQDYALSDGTDLSNLGQAPQNPSWYLGILGMLWWPRRLGRWVRLWGKSLRSWAAAWSGSPAVRKNAPM